MQSGQDPQNTPPVLPDSAADEFGKYPFHWLFRELGDRWSLPVVSTLLDGPMRFAELKHALKPVSQRMLALSLRKLEQNGLVFRRVAPTTPPQVSYELTEIGQALRAPLGVFASWMTENKTRIAQARAAFTNVMRLRRMR